MLPSFKRISSTGLCVFSLFSSPAMALQTTPPRMINFYGAIAEASCNIDSKQKYYELSCFRDGRMHKKRYNLHQVTTENQYMQKIATIKMHYLNEQKKLAIFNIDYK